MTEEDRMLAAFHLGMMLAHWDDENPYLVASLNEAQNRIFNVFGVDLRVEANILEARNKVAAVIEVLGGENDVEVH